MTLYYECDRCGVCCQGTLIVEAYGLDVLREPRVLHADVNGRVPTVEELLADDGKCIVSFRQACMNWREAFGIVGCRRDLSCVALAKREAAWRTVDENRNDARLSRRAGINWPAFRAVASDSRWSLAYTRGIVGFGSESGRQVRA